MRNKESFGTCHVNPGSCVSLNENKYVVDHTRQFYLFDIIPMGAPRMTQSDKWKKRPVVMQYRAYKDLLRLQANTMQFSIGEYFDAVYFLPMPDSWSNKKKLQMNGTPCKVKPDTDNITKGIKDCFSENDSNIWYERAEKRWAYRGSILIYK